MRDTWEPKSSDIVWASKLIRMMNDGDSWCMPMNNTVYKVDHKNKTLTLIEGRVDVMFFRNSKCFGKIGYKVLQLISQ
jgi:hypothetical protein